MTPGYTCGEFRKIIDKVRQLQSEAESLMHDVENWYAPEAGAKAVRAAETVVVALRALEKILRAHPVPRPITPAQREAADYIMRRICYSEERENL